MRSKRLIDGLNNSQKIRFIVDGVGMYCQIKDITNIATTTHRVAVWDTLMTLANERYFAERRGTDMPMGLARTQQVLDYKGNEVSVQVQVDLCDELHTHAE